MNITIGEYYPTEIHKKAAEQALDFFAKNKSVEAILLVNSCSRGKATTDSCLDIAVLVDSSMLNDFGNSLEQEWEDYYSSEKDFREFENVGLFAEVHAYTFDGDFIENGRNWTSGPDTFEIEIGNTLVYSHPIFNRTNRFNILRDLWLPYYEDTLRNRRLEKVKRYFLNNIAHIRPYVTRGLHFQAFKRLHQAFEEFLQALFIFHRTYPLCYDKWIHEHIVEILGLKHLYPQLLQISDFCGTEIVVKATTLNNLFEEYIAD